MFYAWDITVTENTTEEDPKTAILVITKGVLTKAEIKFARGCHGLVKVRILTHEFCLIPLSRDEWVTGDDEAVTTDLYQELETTPYELKFVGCSPGTTYPHTVTVRLTVLPKRVASMIPVIELLSRLLSRMGVL